MPLNVFKSFSGSRGDGEGFFQRGFRRNGRSGEDSRRGYPSIRRQVLTKGFRPHDEVGLYFLRTHSLPEAHCFQPQEVILPVLPPNFSRRSSMQNYTDDNSLDDESFVDVPRDIREPSIHYAPGTHGAMPAVEREEYPDRAYEPSMHHFDTPPSAQDEYSDMGESPISDSPQYPMGGYSGRDMVHDPVQLNPSPIVTTGSMDSRNNDHYVEDGRRHPAFSRSGSQACDLSCLFVNIPNELPCYSLPIQSPRPELALILPHGRLR